MNKIKIMNKQAKMGLGGGIFAGLVVFAAVFLVISLIPQESLGGDVEREDVPISACAESTGAATITAVSKLDGATDPSSPTITCGVDGGKVKTSVTSGTTTFPVGSMLSCLVSKADYIDTSFEAEMPCGGLQQQVDMYYATSDNPSLTLRDPNNADASLTDAIGGGAGNLTDPDVGGTVDFEVEFKGTNTEGTGELVYVVEFPAGSGSNITDVTMGTLEKTNIPQIHTLQNAGSKAVAFKVPNVEGALKAKYDVVATLSTGSDVTGGVYTDWYAGQDFVDDDGFISSGIEDSDGTAKHENTADYDFLIA